MRSGPICHLCGAVVPTVSWVTIDRGADQDGPDPAIDAQDDSPAAAPAKEDEEIEGQAGPEGNAEPPTGAGQEVGLCPDCLSSARARGRLLAPIIPLRAGHRRRRRAPE